MPHQTWSLQCLKGLSGITYYCFKRSTAKRWGKKNRPLVYPQRRQLDELIEEINDIEETAAAEHQEAGRIKQDKADQDKTKADDMRGKAMETLGETKKRQAQDEKGRGVAVILLSI